MKKKDKKNKFSQLWAGDKVWIIRINEPKIKNDFAKAEAMKKERQKIIVSWVMRIDRWMNEMIKKITKKFKFKLGLSR